jgi:ribosomal protein S18 acetylase RimI-like enzyme
MTFPFQTDPVPLDPSQLEILDLRHFSAAQLGPLLRDEAIRWERRLNWDYTSSVQVLLDYIDTRTLPGFVALYQNRILGYAFAVFEATKAVVGDVYAFGEGEAIRNPVCDKLLDHLLEMLQAAPAVDRIESQLLMFPAGALSAPMQTYGFRTFPRLFMSLALNAALARRHADDAPTPPGFTLQSWKLEFYDAAADLIHRAYAGHCDSEINDQYRTVHGAQRFLHNIIRFPGCGVFDLDNSWVLRDPHTTELHALILCSRVRRDVAHITQLCVRPSSRSLGLGTFLLAHSARALMKHGFSAISLTVTEENSSAVRLYERYGFTAKHRFEAQVWSGPR